MLCYIYKAHVFLALYNSKTHLNIKHIVKTNFYKYLKGTCNLTLILLKCKLKYVYISFWAPFTYNLVFKDEFYHESPFDALYLGRKCQRISTKTDGLTMESFNLNHRSNSQHFTFVSSFSYLINTWVAGGSSNLPRGNDFA